MKTLVVVTALLLAIPAAAQELLVPAAGSTPGVGGTFFHSDIAIFNHRDVSQRVTLRWLPQAGAPNINPITVTVPAFSAISSEDFVAEILHTTGLGSILVQPIDQNGNPMLNTGVAVTSRIWTPQPGTQGVVSQSFSAVPTAQIDSRQLLLVLGQRIDQRFRTNVGIVNLDAAQTMEFDIIQNTADSTTIITHVTVPPASMQQVGLPFAPVPVLDLGVQVRSPSTATRWIAYGSTVENVTGDSWSNIGTKTQ